MRLKLAIAYILGLTLYCNLATAISYDEYMQKVKSENKVFRSLNTSLESANERLLSGDVILAPVFSAGASKAVDKSLPSPLGPSREMTEYTLGLTKKFTTGTNLTLAAKTDQFSNELPAPADHYSTGSIGITVQQSLLKDFYGRSTEYRRSRELIINQTENTSIDLRLRQALYDAEATFWDYAFAAEDLKLKKSNFERAKRLEQWTSSRVSNGISDRADLMNVKALAAVREVQLVAAEDEIKTQETKFREYLVLADSEPTPVLQTDLNATRNTFADLAQKKNVVKIDAYLSVLDARVKKVIADEVQEGLRPDLSLIGSYNTSAYDREYDQVTKNISNSDRPKTFIGVNFSWIFDTESKRAQLSSANKDAMAAEYLAERNLTLGRNAWSDMVRKYESTKRSVSTLEKVAQYQRERAKAEQDRLSKGRTITANVVTAETDAAEAAVTLLKAQSGLRKLEASSILFMSVPN